MSRVVTCSLLMINDMKRNVRTCKMAANVAGHIDEVLREGGESAREIAIDTMRDVRRLVGFTPL